MSEPNVGSSLGFTDSTTSAIREWERKEALKTLATTILVETVRAMATAGGLLSDEGVRESVRQARVFYAELETPTPRAAKDDERPSTARTVDDDGDVDASGLADLLGG